MFPLGITCSGMLCSLMVDACGVLYSLLLHAQGWMFLPCIRFSGVCALLLLHAQAVSLWCMGLCVPPVIVC